MKVLMVGCGAVGQVFSLFLQKAGVELGLYDRPATVDRLKQALEQGGLPLFQISRSRGRDPSAHRLENYRVMQDVAECQQFNPDQIWFCTPSPVYYSDWFREFLRKVPSGRVVCFVPEGARSEFFPESGDKDRLVFGGITFMAWQGDLGGGGGRQEGVNFFLPPFISIPLSGTEIACGEVGQLLKKGGLRVGIQKQGFPMQASVTGVMTAFMAGMELSGWSFKGFRKSPWLKRAATGSREAAMSQLSRAGIFIKMVLGILLSSPGLFLVTFILPLLFPFDLEKYIRFHYTKTREQTLTLLEVFIKDGIKRGLAMENLQVLLNGLRGPA